MLLAVTGVDKNIINTDVRVFRRIMPDCAKVHPVVSLIKASSKVFDGIFEIARNDWQAIDKRPLLRQLVLGNFHVSPFTCLCLVCTYYIIRVKWNLRLEPRIESMTRNDKEWISLRGLYLTPPLGVSDKF